MNRKTLSVATFNLLNLNLPGLAMYADKEGWSEDEYARKIDWTERVLRLIDADIVGLQELWHRDAMVAAVEAAGMAETHDLLTPEPTDGKRIVCAALVRKGLIDGEPEWITGFPEGFVLQSRGDDAQTEAIRVTIDSFSRPVLHFTIAPRDDHDPVHVYVCHFKSKGPTKVFREPWFTADEDLYKKHQTALGAALSTIRRTAEAAALRFILTEQMRGNRTPVIVLGDINDGQHSNTANILTEQPRFLVGDSVGGGDAALYTVQTLQEYRSTRDVYYTHIYQDIMESLDHILVSEEFYDNSRRRLWMFDGMRVMNDHLDDDDHARLGTNDHGIILARFKHKPMKAEARRIADGTA